MLVLLRHGQSEWNLQNRFTGWVDVDLTEKGVEEAKEAGRSLKSEGLHFDVVYSSYLKRAIKTCQFVLEESEQHWLSVTKSWRLNERHYGGLQGLNKKETAEKHGADQVFQWRRSYGVLPPEAMGPLQESLEQDPRYKGIKVPKGEALKETVERVWPYWQEEISQWKKNGQDKNILVVAHGNSLRALVKCLTGMSEEEIVKFEFKTGVPLVCELDGHEKINNMKFLNE